MKLKFSRGDNGNAVEVIKEKDVSEAFSYPIFIQYILDGEDFEDVVFEPLDLFEDYEQTAIKSMIGKIKAAVNNSDGEDSASDFEGNSNKSDLGT